MILDDVDPLLDGLVGLSPGIERHLAWRTFRWTTSAWARANWVCSTSICFWREEMVPTHPYTGSRTLALASYTMLLTASPRWCIGRSCKFHGSLHAFIEGGEIVAKVKDKKIELIRLKWTLSRKQAILLTYYCLFWLKFYLQDFTQKNTLKRQDHVVQKQNVNIFFWLTVESEGPVFGCSMTYSETKMIHNVRCLLCFVTICAWPCTSGAKIMFTSSHWLTPNGQNV